MKILVVGSGGREHALVWKFGQSPLVEKIFCAPGNPGIAGHAQCVPLNIADLPGLLKFAKEQRIDLTVVGPEQPLTAGIVDLFESHGLVIFGPTKLAAELEGSKVFAKTFMEKYGIPTAAFRSFSKEKHREAEEFLRHLALPIVIKADGLAGGKGVVLSPSYDEARRQLDLILNRRLFGDAGRRVVIEEFLNGEEASVFAVTDGKTFTTLAPAQDHKRVSDNDEGKNTGGMGAYAPAPVVSREMLTMIERSIIQPTIEGMEKEGRPFRGCLYAGLMITKNGPKVIEFNCRFGDPETQVVLPLAEGDIVPVFLEAARGNLRTTFGMKNQTAVCIVLASGGYPDEYAVDKPVSGLDFLRDNPDILVFHAGTKMTNNKILSAGGRVLGVTAIADRLKDARTKAYSAVSRISFDGMHYRKDIAVKGINSLEKTP